MLVNYMVKILIIRLSSLGDIIHSYPMVYDIKSNVVYCKIDWLFDEYQRQAPIYLAPELLVQKKKFNEAVDVWSLGYIIYNMVTSIPTIFDENID